MSAHTPTPKLSPPQVSVLTLARDSQFIKFRHALRAGGNGKTLSALCAKGLLLKIEYHDGSNEWSITSEGRAALTKSTTGSAEGDTNA